MSDENKEVSQNDNVEDALNTIRKSFDKLNEIAASVKRGKIFAVIAIVIAIYVLVVMLLALAGDASTHFSKAKKIIYVGVGLSALSFWLAYKTKSNDKVQKISLVACSILLIYSWLAPAPVIPNPHHYKDSSQRTLLGKIKTVDMGVGDWFEIEEWGAVYRVTLADLNKLENGDHEARFTIENVGGKSSSNTFWKFFKWNYFKAADDSDRWHELAHVTSKNNSKTKDTSLYRERTLIIPSNCNKIIYNHDGAFDWVGATWIIP